jgi:glutamine amidotransferase
MCRLFALIAEHPKSSELPDLMVPFRALSRYHPDGWGIGWYFNGGVQVEKSSLPAHKDPRFVTTCMSADSNIILVHIRKTSGTKATPDNTHPFTYGQYIFEHNGTIIGDLKGLLPPEYRNRLLGQTDSEQLFQLILHRIDEEGGVIEGLRSAISLVMAMKEAGTTSLNFILSDGEKVFAYRKAFSHPDRYSLLYRQREETDKYPGRSVIISSQRISRGGWKTVENGRLLVVDKLLQVSIFDV